MRITNTGRSDAPGYTLGGNIPALDGLRGLAILLVIPHNTNFLTDPFPGLSYLWAKFVEAGWTGVQLFFVLSGFLITRALLDSKDSTNYLSAFFCRRVLRIFPLYYGCLLVVLVLWPMVSNTAPDAHDPALKTFWYWIFLANWSGPLVGDVKVIAHFWSLAVEEQFYLLWPFVVLRCTPSQLLKFCGWLMMVALAIRIGLLVAGASPESAYQFTICRMDALAAGAAVASLFSDAGYRRWLAENQAALVYGALILLGIGVLTTRCFYREGAATLSYGYVILELAFAALIAAAAAGGEGTARWFIHLASLKPLRTMGKYSYGMYVIHYPLNRCVTQPWIESFHPSRASGILYALAMVLVSLALAFASYHLIEKHFLRLKRYFVPRYC